MTMYDKRSPADAYSDPENDHYPVSKKFFLIELFHGGSISYA